MIQRIKAAGDAGQRVVLILPNPCPVYRHVARLINALRIDCHHLWAFAMDEYANQDGVIAPETWPQGFVYAMKHYFWCQIDEELRPPESQFIAPTNKNLRDYGKMIAGMGGADMCYSGPGWTGHLAFIEPDAPEFEAATLDEWKQMGPRIVTLSPFTLAQNSLHGSFGMSGDIALGAAKGLHDRAGRGHWVEEPHRLARDHRPWDKDKLAAAHDAPGCPRACYPAAAHLDPPTPAHRLLHHRDCRRRHRDQLGQGILTGGRRLSA